MTKPAPAPVIAFPIFSNPVNISPLDESDVNVTTKAVPKILSHLP